MKKKFSIIPVLAAALTVLFGTVAYGMTNINQVNIDLPDLHEGMTTSEYVNAIEVTAYPSDSAGPFVINGGLIPLTYLSSGVGSSYITDEANTNLGPDYTMETGTLYKFVIQVELNADTAASYEFNLDNNKIQINKDVSNKQKKLNFDASNSYFSVAFSYIFSEGSSDCGCGNIKIIDRDTFKSELPSKTAVVADSVGAKTFLDMKVHAADAKTEANQKLLAQNLIGANSKILVTENIYPRRDLSDSENGSLKVLTWNNLPKNQPGAVFAVVYNQIDGSYAIQGALDANGTATFTGFKLRPASTITICK